MSDRLPMPGEKPTGLWQPRQPQPSKARRWLLVLGLLVAATIAAWSWLAPAISLGSFRAPASAPVLIAVDGRIQAVHTASTDPAAILVEAGVSLGPEDTVTVTRTANGLPRELRVDRARSITLNDGEERTSLSTTAPSLGEALVQAGIVLYESDLVTPPLTTPITEGMEVTLQRSTPVIIQADNRTYRIRTRETTVDGLLAAFGITLNGDDYALPDQSAPLAPDMTVQVVRVTEAILVEQERIPFEIDYRPDPDLELDQQRVLQEGQEGIWERRVRVRYEDGVEVSRTVLDEWMAQAPRPSVVGYGTHIVIRELETPEGTVEYWRVIRVLATSYSPSTAGYQQPGDPTFGITATGERLRYGVIAVDPRVIGLYTWLYVPGYGVGQALDTGGAVKGRRIDLGYEDDELVLWYDWVDVYLLTPVPPPDEIPWVLP
jgi:uncharacterized protein YabE (DUF348 family)